jgi:hypothetical protein
LRQVRLLTECQNQQPECAIVGLVTKEILHVSIPSAEMVFSKKKVTFTGSNRK